MSTLQDRLASIKIGRIPPPLLALSAIFLLSVMDALIKSVGAHYGVVQIALMRFCAGALVMFAVVLALRPGWPSREALRINGLRALLVVCTALSFFYALKVLPLAEALALSFLSPIFLAVLGVVVLKEMINLRIIIGLIAGLAGMLMIVFGGAIGEAARPWLGVAAALVSAFTYALALILLRQRAGADPIVTIVFIQNLAPALILAGPGIVLFTPVSTHDFALLLLIGVFGSLGHLAMAMAFARSEAARLAPLEYTGLIWAVSFGYLFFNETPRAMTIGGAALIAAGAVVASGKNRVAPTETMQ